MTYSIKRPLHWVGIVGAVMLIFAGCDYNPSFSPLDSNHDGIRYGFEEQGEGYFEWNITFPLSVQVDPDASSLQLTPEGGKDVLNLDATTWLQDDGISVLAQGKTGPLQAGVYFLRLMLTNGTAYILVVQPIAIHRGQTTTFKQGYSDKDFEPFVLLQVNVQVTSGAPVKLEEATLEFFSDMSLRVPLLQTNGKDDDVRRINMKELNRTYPSEGWTALPQGSTNFLMRLTIRDAKGRHFIRTKKHTITTAPATPIIVNWGIEPSDPITLLNKLAADENVKTGKFTFASMGSDGKLHGEEEGYQGAEPDYEVRIVAAPNDSSWVLKWIQVVSNPLLEDKDGKLVHNGNSGYFTFTMPKEIKPFTGTDLDNIYKGSKDHQIGHDDSFFSGKNAVIVTGHFMVPTGVALLNNPQTTNNNIPDNQKSRLGPTLVNFEDKGSLEEAVGAASTDNKQNTIVIRRDLLEANKNAAGVFVTNWNSQNITILDTQNIALIPQPVSNKETTTIQRTDDSLTNLFTVNGTLTIGINKDTGATFTLDGNGKPNELILVGSSGTLEIQGGIFKGSQSAAAAINVSSGGTFTMTGGTIEDNTHALYIDNSKKVELSGSAFIPHTGTTDSPGNNIVLSNAASQIAITGELTRLSKNEPACLTLADGEADWADNNRKVLTGYTESNYEKFKVTPGNEKLTNQPGGNGFVKKPYTITSEGILYGPQASFDDDTGNRRFFLRLDDAVKEVQQEKNQTIVSLLKNIELGKAGNEALTVTGNSYITVPQGKNIALQGNSHTISRAGSTAKTLFTVNGELDLGLTILDGGKGGGILSSSPMVIVSGTFTLSSEQSTIKNHSGSGLTNAAITVQNGGTLNLKSGHIEDNVSAGYGGAIYNNGGTVKAEDSSADVLRILRNYAGSGGAIYNTGNGKVTLSGNSINLESNTATSAYGGGGGAIYNNSGTVILSGTVTLGSNTANGSGSNGGTIYNNGTVEMSGNAQVTAGEAINGYGAGIYQNGIFKISDSAYLVTSSDVFLPNTKTIDIGNGLSKTKVATITPQGTVTVARQVLSGTIKGNQDRFDVKTPSGQQTANNTGWKINDAGYLFFGFDVSCEIPENPGTGFTLGIQSSGEAYKRSDKISVSLSSANPTKWEARMDDKLISYSSTSSLIELNIPSDASYGRHTITVFVTINGQTYSGSFTIYVVQ